MRSGFRRRLGASARYIDRVRVNLQSGKGTGHARTACAPCFMLLSGFERERREGCKPVLAHVVPGHVVERAGQM